MKVIQVKIEDLKPAEYNPRKADEKQVENIKSSIKEFGLVEPIVVNSAKNRQNIIIGGHLRHRVAELMGYKDIPVVYVNVPDINKERELNLRLNKNLGQWDYDMLANFSEEELNLVGFEGEELDRIFNLDNEEDDFDGEEEYENIEEPTTKLGDLWALGEHKLHCSDSTSKEAVLGLLGDKKADVVFTDPPYNMNYKSKAKGGIIGDNQTEEEFIQFSIDFIQRMKEALKAGGVFYICSGYGSYIPFIYAMKSAGLEFANPIVWVKNSIGMGLNDYRHKHEMIIKAKKKNKTGQPILYGWKAGEHYFIDVHNEADVWEIKRRATNTMVHPTQKPIELISRAIRNSSKRGEIVLDLFGGSGSTLISAEKEGRIAYLMELDPKYCDVIIQRWQKLTNKKAEKTR